MRRMSLFISGLFASAAMTLPAFAAEPGTYRPGSPYYSIPAAAHDTCAVQCQGDAQCKGWNFVRIKPEAAQGVCEFNSQAVSSIPSPISISGDGASIRTSARLSSAGTNTVRVGSPAMPKPTPKARTQKQPSPQARVQRTSPNRRVVRQAVPQRVQPGQAVQRPPGMTITQQQNRQRALTGTAPIPQTRQIQRPAAPRFRHNLDGPHQMRPGMAPQMAPQMNPQADPARDMQRRLLEYQMRERMRQQAGNPAMQAPQSTPMVDPRRQQQAAPQGPLSQSRTPQIPGPQQQALPQRPAANASAPHAQGPNYRGPAAQQAPEPQAQMVPPQPRRPMTVAEAEQSLFGSLYDDVAQPKPITEQEATNPDAPIATTQAVPVKKVTTETLFGLAGGRR